MKALSIEYIAGFFDGEGCVCINKSKDVRNPKGYTDRIRVMVSQVDRTPLDAIMSQFGGIITLRSTGVHELVMSDMATISAFLTRMLPHLIVKRMVAERGIAFCEVRRETVRQRTERDAQVRELRASDPKTWTLKRLAEHFGLVPQRISQIVNMVDAGHV